jgi:8-oxo-dGTP pyrophosphatase MutT (NUDIX family)
MSREIRIAAALIEDGRGRMLLVRKRGTSALMQPGGKIERGETALDALIRELSEELHFTPSRADACYLGDFSADAANEPGHHLHASLFHIRAAFDFRIAAEIEEAIGVSIADAPALSLAPLTRDHVLPLARSLCA